MSGLGSYSSIFALGHRALKDLLTQQVNVEEKVDGSQFGFGLLPTNTDDAGNPVDVVHYEIPEIGIGPHSLKIRSKGCVMLVDAPEKMFQRAADTVLELARKLHLGWVYRGEYLARPKHNALAYDRVPEKYIVLFDIQTEDGGFLSYEDKVVEATRLGLETVPRLFSGRLATVEQFRQFMGTVSMLGGQAIEGVVVKPVGYNLYGVDKKVLMGKFVSEAFKEVHRKAWGESNPSNKDIITRITSDYATPARWNKAIQHLREAGKLVEDVKDIGPLIREIPEDVLRECEEDMKQELFKYAWPHIRRGLTAGFPQYYKELLLKRSFEDVSENNQPQEPVVTGETKDDVELDRTVRVEPTVDRD